jgi:hypothetical protein
MVCCRDLYLNGEDNCDVLGDNSGMRPGNLISIHINCLSDFTKSVIRPGRYRVLNNIHSNSWHLVATDHVGTGKSG